MLVGLQFIIGFVRDQYQFNREQRKVEAEISKYSTTLLVLIRAGASLKCTDGLPKEVIEEHDMPSNATPEPQNLRQHKRKRRKSIAIMGRLDAIHECELGLDGSEVWGADYVAQTSTAEVHAVCTCGNESVVCCRFSRSQGRHSA